MAKTKQTTHPFLEPAQLVLTSKLSPKTKSDILQNPHKLRIELNQYWHQLQLTMKDSKGENESAIVKLLSELIVATAKVALYYDLNGKYVHEDPVVS